MTRLFCLMDQWAQEAGRMESAATIHGITPVTSSEVDDPRNRDYIPPAVEKKHVPETLFFCVEDYVDACDIAEFAGRAVEPLYEAAEATGLDVTGSLHFISPEWHEEGEKGRRIFALPVSAPKEVPEPWFFWTAPAFDCIAKDHTGSFDRLGSAWEAFTKEVLATGLKRAGGWREVYRYVVSPESPDNITELQLGVE